MNPLVMFVVMEVWIDSSGLSDERVSDLVLAAAHAAAVWNNVEQPGVRIEIAGVDSLAGEAGVNEVHLVTNLADAPVALVGRLAITEPHVNSYGDPVGGDIWINAVEFDWDTRGGYRLRAVLAHEFGHMLGLPDIRCRGAVMSRTLSPGATRSRPLYCDLLRYRAQWGGPAPEPDPEDCGGGSALLVPWMVLLPRLRPRQRAADLFRGERLRE